MFSPALPTVHGKLLAPILCGICMALPAIPAQAEVYRCKDKSGAVVYQEIACPSAGEAIRLQTNEPSEADRINTDERTRRERAFIDNVNAERDRNSDLAQQDREKAQAEKAEKKARCDNYLAEAKRLENIVEDRADKNRADKIDNDGRKHGNYNTHTGTSTRDQRNLDKARDLRNQYFSECSKL